MLLFKPDLLHISSYFFRAALPAGERKARGRLEMNVVTSGCSGSRQ
jgi:hypothetical protein